MITAEKAMPRLIRLDHIIGRREVTADQADKNRLEGKGPKRARAAVQGLIPVSRSTFYLGMKTGKFPKPVRGICERAIFWRVSEVMACLAKVEGETP